MRSIVVRRLPGWYGRLRSLRILVDGREVAVLRQREEVRIELDDDAAALWGAMDWASTSRVALHGVQDGQSVTFRGVWVWSLARELGLGALPFDVSVT